MGSYGVDDCAPLHIFAGERCEQDTHAKIKPFEKKEPGVEYGNQDEPENIEVHYLPPCFLVGSTAAIGMESTSTLMSPFLANFNSR